MRIFILTVFGLWFASNLNQTYHEDFVFDGMILLTIAIMGLFMLVMAVIYDRKDFKATGALTSFLSTGTGVFLILANIGLFYYLDSRMNSPTLIKGFNDGGFNGFLVDFKTNGTYVMANGSGLGQRYFYGTFTMKDSNIVLDKSSIDNCISSNKLVIRTQGYSINDSAKSLKTAVYYITQVDDKGVEVDQDFRFLVTTDNRSATSK